MKLVSKSRIITLLLLGSVLLNIAGLVFFILFLNLRSSYKAVRRDKAIIERNLAAVRSQNAMGAAQNDSRIRREVFSSYADGELDTYAFQPPTLLSGKVDYVLVVYLHGMGSNYMEPFVAPASKAMTDAISGKDASIGILSCSYRKQSSWGNDKALSDINQNVREVLQKYPFSKIVVMGTSMGGSVALNYAAVAPADIKEKIAGVVSIEPTGDLAKLYAISKNADIRMAMIMALGGTPEQIPDVYKKKSVLANLSLLSKNQKFYILSAKKDSIVPAVLQQDLVRELKNTGLDVKLSEVDDNHGVPPADFYIEGMQFVLGK